MNIKHLPMKFSLLALVVVLCLWALNALPVPFLMGTGPGLREGTDLAGGYSLDFKLRSAGLDVAQLEQQKKDLTAKLDGDLTDEERKKAEKALSFIQDKLDRQAKSPKADSQRLIEAAMIIAERLNPNGLLAIEIIPMPHIGGIRVRMPAAKPEARRAEEAFRQAMRALKDGNISSSQARRIKTIADPAELARQIGRVSAGIDRRSEALTAMAAAYQLELTTRQAFDSTQGSDARREARIALDNATYEYDKRLAEVMATNVNVDELRSVLNDNYVTRRQERQLEQMSDGKEKIADRTRSLTGYVAGLTEESPSRAEQIQAVVDTYSIWAEQRQTLGDADDVISIISRAGVLEFRIAPASSYIDPKALPEKEYMRLSALLASEGPEGPAWQGEDFRWLVVKEGATFPNLVVERYLSRKYLLVYDKPGKVMLADRSGTGWQLEQARQARDNQTGRPNIAFTLDAEGGRRMRDLTSNHVDHSMAIILDDVAYSAPNILEAIGERGSITGMDMEEIPELVRTLNAGWLSLDPNPVSQSRFGPALGQDNKDRGLRAAVWAMIGVASFMLIYYMLPGGIANIALLINVTLILGFMSLFQVVLTLPGIAGLILTIGIAVDANVLIFERLREEQAKGQSPAMTIKNAYQRAFSAIFDANITTVITCVILGWVGTTEIRGFAIVLGLGVTFSMFTSLVVTRWIFQALLNRGLITGKVKMLQIVGVPKIDWISKRHFFWGISGVMLVLGIVSLVKQGGDILGIEFSSGTQITIVLKPDAMIPNADGVASLPSDGLLRDVIRTKAQNRGSVGDKVATGRVEQRLIPQEEAVQRFLVAAIDEGLAPSEATEAGLIPRDQWSGDGDFFNAIDTDGDGTMTRDELMAGLPPSTYQLTTTETDEGLVVAVINDGLDKILREDPAVDEYTFVTSQYDQALGLNLANDGLTRVHVARSSDYRDLLAQFDNGVVFKIVDLSVSLSEANLFERIDSTRYRSGFADRPLAETVVVGLDQAEDNLFRSFLVFSRPVDEATSEWQDFAETEKQVLVAALARQDLMRINYDAQIAGQAKGMALMAIILSCIAIVLYLWLRFGSIQWGLAAVICLAHDVIIVVGLVAASAWLKDTTVGRALGIQSFKIDLAMVGAFLTVIGYSVNDTIVVFDRIRENRGKLNALTPQIINRSINQTLSRTLLTSSTTLIVVAIMYLWGGPGIHAFSYALLAGVLFGTYSSIAVASPLLLGFKKAFVSRPATNEGQDGK